jgi:hypothetical protein
MSDPIDNIDPILQAPIRGRLGTYTLRVYDLEQEVTPVGDLEVEGGVIQFGKRSQDYGQFVRKSFAEVTFQEIPQRIRTAFSGPFSDIQYPVTITGPGVRWRGLVKSDRRSRPIDPRQAPRSLSITAYDGLARLENLPPISPGDATADADLKETNIITTLDEVLKPVQKSLNGSGGYVLPCLLRYGRYFDVEGNDYTLGLGDPDWDEGWLDSEPITVPTEVFEGNSSRMKQLVSILKGLGCVVYMTMDKGRLEVVPREDLGFGAGAVDLRQAADEWYASETITSGFTSPPNRFAEVLRPRTADSDDWETIKGGAVKFDLGSDYNLLLDPFFRDAIKGGRPERIDDFYFIPQWWTPLSEFISVGFLDPVPGEGILLGAQITDPVNTEKQVSALYNDNSNLATGGVSVDVLQLSKQTPDMRAVLFFKAWWPSDEDGNEEIDLTLSHGSNSASLVGGLAEYKTEEYLSVELLDTASTLSIDLEGSQLFIYDLKLQLFEGTVESGRRVETLIIGDDGPEPVEVDQPIWFLGKPSHPSREGLTDSSIEDTYKTALREANWNGDTYYHPLSLAAAKRLVQQPLGTQVAETSVDGLQGPGTRLVWSDGAETLPVGRKVNLLTGRTEITDVSVPSELQGGSGSDDGGDGDPIAK